MIIIIGVINYELYWTTKVITGIYPPYYEMIFCVVFLLLEFFFSFSFIIREQPHSVKRGVAV